MLEIIALPGAITAIYANGESPNDENCLRSWRKHNPNMLVKASKDFNIDLSKSILIGDRLSDIQSGENAGLKSFIHVLTGHGKEERVKVIKNYCKPNKSYNLKLVDNLLSLKNKDFLKDNFSISKNL